MNIVLVLLNSSRNRRSFIASRACSTRSFNVSRACSSSCSVMLHLYQSRQAVIPEAQVILCDDALQVLHRYLGCLLDGGQRLAVLVQPDGSGYFRGGYSDSTHAWSLHPFSINCNSFW